MELRHLRYFIAVAEEGSFLTAAERRLHTAQPSLSRRIRDLESEVGVKLLERRARGVVLTADSLARCLVPFLSYELTYASTWPLWVITDSRNASVLPVTRCKVLAEG
jgi:hypothetical protein